MSSNRYDWIKVQEYYDQYPSLTKVVKEFGMNRQSFYNAIERGDLIKRNAFELILNGTAKFTRSRKSIKTYLLNKKILKNECSECHIGPEWNDKELILVLDHINGINNDNTLDNLRLLCPNCNSQTETFSGRNIKRITAPSSNGKTQLSES